VHGVRVGLAEAGSGGADGVRTFTASSVNAAARSPARKRSH
jgi:hypothetical protein